ncbi:mitochondrial assembly of ribosomal large subunit protein 1 [Denticeps clupeoides]|uniref:mitochondrial assembly of ribosomal large subunit protein 1 n=1 Tax=Denticeps clupeoides TaxID=299321 RepID=UPI0010A34F3B|nr:mitochondrial assembly of ribosomal large subunit protein 1 [Denticeps clupeoides]
MSATRRLLTRVWRPCHSGVGAACASRHVAGPPRRPRPSAPPPPATVRPDCRFHGGDRGPEASRERGPEVFGIDVLVSLLRQENAVDVCVVRVPAALKYAEYFVVVSGSSPRHLRAMALYAVKVYKFMRRDDNPHVRIEGKEAEDWMCIDFGDMVVHFMLPETRDAYELEKLWTLRSYDEQLSRIPPETLPTDFVYEADVPK